MKSPYVLPEAYREWGQIAADFGFVDFMSAENRFETCLASGRAWPQTSACGLYFWVAENGECYVGQTVNSRARLMEHARQHPDLRYACFQPVPRAELDARETDLIERASELLPTRNIKRALKTQVHVPFDDFITSDERETHLSGENVDDQDDPWRDLATLMQKHARRFDRLKHEMDADEAMAALMIFLWSAVPRPRRLEVRFWSVSLFPGPHLLRVNAGQQEVFTITRVEDGSLYARVLALGSFGGDAEGPVYQTKSYVHWMPLDEVPDWLNGERLLSCRELVIRLMRHTTTLNSGSHCPQVFRAADQLVRSISEEA